MLDRLALSLREYGIDDIGVYAVLQNDQLL